MGDLAKFVVAVGALKALIPSPGHLGVAELWELGLAASLVACAWGLKKIEDMEVEIDARSNEN